MNKIERTHAFSPSPRLILLILMAYAAVLVPIIAITYSYNTQTLLLSAAGFLILLAAGACLWFLDRRINQRGQSGPVDRTIRVGITLGLLWVAEISVNNFIAPPLPARDIIDDIFWAIIAISIFLFAIISTVRSGHFRDAIVAGAWTGSVSGAFACCMALSIAFFGTSLLTHDPLNIAEWAARGTANAAPSMAAYFAYETFAGAFLHLVILGLGMGLFLGVLGGGIGKAIRAFWPR